MIVQRRGIFELVLTAAGAALALPTEVRAQSMRVVETSPAANATIDNRPTGFYVRFDRPVDHVRSTLIIERGREVLQTLHPRLNAAPEVLFAQAPALEPGDYTFAWVVAKLNGGDVERGKVAFSVAAGKRAKQ